jgi:hypothetical protein
MPHRTALSVALLGGLTTLTMAQTAQAGNDAAVRTRCAFCSSRPVAEYRHYSDAQMRRENQPWMVRTSYPFSRIDIEGIRRLERMP